MIAALPATDRDQGETPKPPNEWFLHVYRITGRASWIRAAAACRPREERAAIFALSVLDERIDSMPCAFPGCGKPRRGPLCEGHRQQAQRGGGFRSLRPLQFPTRSAARRIVRDAPKRLPAALRTDEPCRKCGAVEWRVATYHKPDRPMPGIVRKCLNCRRLHRRASAQLVAMPATGNMREVIA